MNFLQSGRPDMKSKLIPYETSVPAQPAFYSCPDCNLHFDPDSAQQVVPERPILSSHHLKMDRWPG